MKKKVKIEIKGVVFDVELYDTDTASEIYNNLPISGRATLWGNEIYFSIPLKCKLEPEAKVDLEVGDLGYYPPLQAFCIFFGPTPVSDDNNKPKAAGTVNIFGKISGDISKLKNANNGNTVLVYR